MDTPVYDFLKDYCASGKLRCHMPGHKGKGYGLPPELYDMDITEIVGADSLFEADGIIAAGERNTSELYGTAATVWSAGGSTLCIQAMLAVMKQEGRHVIAVRNVHRAFLNAAALLGMEVDWLMPDYSGGILSGSISLKDVEEKLKKCTQPACIYVTSPDYTGKTADIGGIAGICHRYDARLIVDNAHGAHLRFMPGNLHPIHLGADMCCDSAHKMLPAFTGAAYLHTSRSEYAGMLKQAMGLFGSTSPSYLIMASLDVCNKYISERINEDIAKLLPYLEGLRRRFSGRLLFSDGDPFHITIKASESGYDGGELAEALRKNGCEYEYADSELCVLLMSPSCSVDDVLRLEEILEHVLKGTRRIPPVQDRVCFPEPERVMSIRDAVFAPCEEIPVEEAEGRICGAVNVPCPPAVPIAASGEIISRECINIFKRYGIRSVNVVK